jgi:hypothetical protein
LHFVPRRRTSSQFFRAPKFLSRLGDAPRLLTTISSEPSLSRSAAADPRDDRASSIAGPAVAEMSLNFPPPTFQ